MNRKWGLSCVELIKGQDSQRKRVESKIIAFRYLFTVGVGDPKISIRVNGRGIRC